MQSVVTGQAPITLEGKTTSGGKQMKTEDSTHNRVSKKRNENRTEKCTRGGAHGGCFQDLEIYEITFAQGI